MSGTRKPRRASKQQSETTLILCQGKLTEPYYFRALIGEYRSPSITVDSMNGDDPIKMVKKGANKKRQDGYDRIFIVVDVDDFRIDQLRKAATSARNQGMYLIVSNVCFEVWLLAHSRNLKGTNYTREELLKKLVTCGYYEEKGRKKTTKGFPLKDWENAMNNIHILLPNEIGENPATAVPVVVEAIASVSKNH